MDNEQTQNEQLVDNPFVPKEGLISAQDPIALNIEDEKLIEIIDDWVTDNKKKFDSEYDLTTRRKENEKYYFGRQLKEKDKKGEIKVYQSRYINNEIWESEAHLKPLALSKLPDFKVTTTNETPDSKKVADDLTEVVNTDIKSRKRREVLGLGFKHNPVYFIGVIKAIWDFQKNDYDFIIVHPDNVIFDFYASGKEATEMRVVAEYLPITPKEVLMRFPDKKEEFLAEFRKEKNINVEDIPEKAMASKIKIMEIWFTWFDKNGDKWERIEGTLWKYNKVMLKKGKNPYFDYSGEKRLFTYKQDKEEELGLEQLQSLALGQGLSISTQSRQIFRNYFKDPQKPYILIGYEQWGKTPIDETSRIEQSIPLQNSLDKRGQQVDEMIDRARGKHIWSKLGGLKAEDLEDLDMSDPEVDMLVDEDVNKVHAFIAGEQPSAQMFKDKADASDKIRAKAGVQAITGEIQTDVATTNQIAREANFTRADDLVEDTINYASEKMAQWAMQFIKLFYTEEHLKEAHGADGSIIHKKLHRDLVDDGMEVVIKSSSTDKLRAEKLAKEAAQLKMIDPLSYYEDVGLTDPKGRTKRLIDFMADSLSYSMKHVEGLEGTNQQVDALNGQGSSEAIQAIMMLTQGQQPPLPQQVDEGYMQTLTNFLQSEEFNALPPELQQIILEFAAQVSAMFDQTQGQMGAMGQMQPQMGGNMPQPPMNPTPNNTATVPQMRAGAPNGSVRNL